MIMNGYGHILRYSSRVGMVMKIDIHTPKVVSFVFGTGHLGMVVCGTLAVARCIKGASYLT